MKKNCMKEVETNLILESSGASRERAYANIFSDLRKKIYDKVDGLIIHMEPLEVYELETKRETRTEKFLGLFMPREKEDFYVKVEVVVRVKYIQS